MSRSQTNFSLFPTQLGKAPLTQQYFHQPKKLNKIHLRQNYNSLTALPFDLPLLYEQTQTDEKPFTAFSHMRQEYQLRNTNTEQDLEPHVTQSLIQRSFKTQIKQCLELNKHQLIEVSSKQQAQQWKSYNTTYQEAVQTKQSDTMLTNKIKIKDNLEKQIKKENQIKFLKYQSDIRLQTQNSTMLENLKSITIYGYSITNTLQWRPQVREGPSLTYYNYKIYLYGGVSQQLFNDWSLLNINGWSWRKIGKGTGEVPFQGRYVIDKHLRFGHTCNVYKNHFVVFGGECRYNSDLHIRECYNQALLFDPKESVWQQIKTHGQFIEPRRNHTACIINQFLFVIGGVDSHGKLLRDVSMLNLETGKWQILNFVAPYQSGLAFHTCVPIFKDLMEFTNPYESVFHQKDEKGKRIQNLSFQHEGMYIYGGTFAEGIADDVQSKLYILQLGEKPLQMIPIVTYGRAPPSLALHTMNHCQELNIMVVYGGRRTNQNLVGSGNQMYVLNLFNYIWTPVKVKGFTYHTSRYNRMLPRLGHQALMIDQKLLIFGGFHNDMFSSCDILIWELDNQKVRKMIKFTKEQTNQEYNPQQQFADKASILAQDIQLLYTKRKASADDSTMFQVLVSTNDTNMNKKKHNLPVTHVGAHLQNYRSYLPIPQRENKPFMKSFLQSKLKRFDFVINPPQPALKDDSI